MTTSSFMGSWLDLHSRDNNLILHHYTTPSGMLGITSDRTLWGGHPSWFNDPLEVKYGQLIISDVLKEFLIDESNSDVIQFINGMKLYVQAFNNTLYDPFVVCFCESGNLLSQWRGYANSGAGYCLEFEISDSTMISSQPEVSPDERRPNLRKIIYDPKQQGDLARTYIENVIGSAREALERNRASRGSKPPMSNGTVMAIEAVNILLDMLMTFKHPAFEEEQEWRLVRVKVETYQAESLRFRATTRGIVPYWPIHVYEYDSDGQRIFPIKSIRFGPTHEPDSAKRAIELLKHQLKVDRHHIIIPSDMQIREAGYSLR